MKNLYNSPFEYWEKIGYVGYNNYTDLHLNVKTKKVIESWGLGLTQKKSNNTIYNNGSRVSKKNIHFLSFIFYNFLKNIHVQSFILKKIIFFFSTWKKKYVFFIKKHIKHRVIKFYMLFFFKKIIFSYFISLKKWHKLSLLLKKKKLYEYLATLYTVPGTKRKIFFFKKILKSLMKNYTFSNKHMVFFNNMFSDNKKTNLSHPQYISNLLSIENSNYEEKGLFKTIPVNVNNHVKKELTLFICATFNTTIFQIKQILSTHLFKNWKDFFYFLHYNSTKSSFGFIEEYSFDTTYFMHLVNIIICVYIYTNIFSNYVYDIYTICAHLVE